MNYTSETIIRVVRGIVGLVLVIAGILYSSWVGFLGAFLLLGAVTGGCGFGSSCEIKPDRKAIPSDKPESIK